ncbi:hypothetical protein M7I_0485 [Glarea lozoyensis 74030]|uniref:Uncharacterized protein n=1 Tax=Glarea lozoyensis (strain ATCC 74030 / MF5533) TaxID=1104152 RepID=H0EDN0_GLAL7|nr:hypothetical protein M7I_0485 [Glarea lozoyensis 74030]
MSMFGIIITIVSLGILIRVIAIEAILALIRERVNSGIGRISLLFIDLSHSTTTM